MITPSIIGLYDPAGPRPLVPLDLFSVSAVGDYYSAPIVMRNSVWYSAHLVWTGDLNGVFTIETSNDPCIPKDWETQLRSSAVSSAVWFPVPDYVLATTSGAPGAAMTADTAACGFVRVKYTNVSGSGTIRLWFCAKD